MVAFRDVLDWVEGKLEPAAAERVRRAVEADPSLGEAAQWIRSFRTAAAAERLEAPPAHVRELLMRRFAAYRPAPPTALERIRAAIGFDSALGEPLLGVRTGATISTRHLVLTTDPADVALDLYPEDRSVRVEGQVLPNDDEASAAGTVSLLRDGAVLARAPFDETGRFALPPVPAGEAILTIALGTSSIEADLVLAV
jgi:hypothetical protein